MHKSLLAIIILFGFLVACKEEQKNITIERSKLVEVIADLHVAEEMIGKFREEDKDSIRNLLLSEISVIHGLDTSLIFSEIKIIQDNPELGLEIYGEAYDLLETHSKTYDKSKKNAKDSAEENKINNK